MPSSCDKCSQVIRNAHSVNCRGICAKVFCAKCAGVSEYDIKSVLIKPNILYMCDICIDYRQTVLEKFEKVLSEVTESKNKIAEQECEIKQILCELKSISKNENQLISEIKKSGEKETYAEKLRAEPPLIIKPKAKQNPAKTKEDLQKKVDPSNLKITGVTAKHSGVIEINSDSKEETLKIKKAVEKNLGNEYEVKVPVLRNPKLYVSGISNKWGEEEIIEKIKCQNEYLKECNLKCLKLIEKQRNKYVVYNAIIETDDNGFKKAMEAKKINIGWDRCPVYDGTTVKRCFKCLGFNHKSTDCKNEEVCAKCAGKHDTRKCNSVDIVQRCINCERANEKLKLDLNCDHNVWSKDCPVYVNKLKMEKRRLGY